MAPLTGSALTAGMSQEQRFWFRVDKSQECWIWTGSKDSHGYGQMRFNGSLASAHRISYEMANGSIPAGMQIDHACYSPPCVNPLHLSAVTQKQNLENRRGAQSNSKSGVRGVSRNKKGWKAEVTHHGQGIHIGTFPTIAEAEAAAVAKRNELFTNNLLDRRAAEGFTRNLDQQLARTTVLRH